TNPPYYANALKPPDPRRERARHDHSLRHDEIVVNASRLLAAEGRLSIILPWAESKPFESLAACLGLYCARACDVHSKPAKPPIRRLMEFHKFPLPTQRSTLCLLDAAGHSSAEYRSLLTDFYLNF
ncbi:MAG TPA: hypothetical protein VF191_08110, partial [Cyclobacteriaceae bacterium]